MKFQNISASPKKSADRGEIIVRSLKQSLALLITLSLVLATPPGGFAYQTDGPTRRLRRSNRRSKLPSNCSSW